MQDSHGKLLLLNTIDNCLKTGKKQSWHATSITNACVGLLSGLKVRFSKEIFGIWYLVFAFHFFFYFLIRVSLLFNRLCFLCALKFWKLKY